MKHFRNEKIHICSSHFCSFIINVYNYSTHQLFVNVALLFGLARYEPMRSLWMSACNVTMNGCRILARQMPRLNVEVIREGDSDDVQADKVCLSNCCWAKEGCSYFCSYPLTIFQACNLSCNNLITKAYLQHKEGIQGDPRGKTIAAQGFAYFTQCFGMKLLRKRDIPEERYTNAFLGYGPEDSQFVVELAYNYGVDKYDIGTGFGHFGIAVEDVAKTVDLIKAKGGKVTREPGPVKGGKSVIAFIEDPDGYKFELLERGPTPEPLCQVMLRVGDLDRSVDFYKNAFGMELLRKRDNPEYKYTIAMMGYGPEDKNAVLELTYNYGVKEYDKGNAYAQIAIGTDDVYKTAKAVKLYGGKVTREPGPLPGINTKITACVDPDGWKTVFVDNIDFSKELE